MLCGNEKYTSSAQWILLTTTAIVAFAGAAAADGHTSITFSGDATLGFNDNDNTLVTQTNTDDGEVGPETDDGESDGTPTGAIVGEDGFYWDANVGVAMSAMLDNGLTAGAEFDFDVADNNLGQELVSASYVLSLTSDNAGLYFGDVDPVAEDRWGGVDGASVADFNDQDVHFDTAGFDAMLVGEATVAGFTAALSYGVALDGVNNLTNKDIDALQLYATGAIGMVDLEVAYQDEFGSTPQIIGVAGTVGVSGADITGAYITDDTETSIGLGAAYPFGPVTVAGYYSFNDVNEDSYGVSADYVDGPIAVNAFYDFTGNTGSTDEESEFGVEGSYDVGNGLTALAGYISTEVGGGDASDQYYVAGTYDLGGGAELLVSYAEDDDDQNDEIGDPEYMSGTTVEVSFKF